MTSMFEFTPESGGSKPEQYQSLSQMAQTLVNGEDDAIANMANLAALIWQLVPDLNWAGFYRVVGDELILGPFIGKPACIRIALGQGVCGAAAQTSQTQLVPDVHAFPSHISCDADSRSELVVPVIMNEKVIAVIDLDSPIANRFDQDDARGVELLAQTIAQYI